MRRLLFCVQFVWLFSFSAAAADLQFAITADAGKTNANSVSTRASIKRAGVLDLILPGDNLYESTYSEVWSPWTADGFRFSVTAIGNHGRSYAEEMQFFGMPSEFYAKQFEGIVRFIVLNSDNESTSSQQAAFLQNQLENATERFVFLVYHHPSYTLSHRHNWEEKRTFQLAIRPILANYRDKITAILVGHDHLALLAQFGDIPVIVSGAIWETRDDSPINNTQQGVAITTQWFYDRHPYWAKLSVPDHGNSTVVQYIRSSDDEVRCSASIVTGQSATLSDNCQQSFPSH